MGYVITGIVCLLIGFILPFIIEECEWRDTSIGFILGLLITTLVLYFTRRG